MICRYVKLLVHVDKPEMIVHLEDNTDRAIADIRPHVLVKVSENWISSLEYGRASRVGHITEVIFKL